MKPFGFINETIRISALTIRLNRRKRRGDRNNFVQMPPPTVSLIRRVMNAIY
ncbi:MAG TPA: hypothetical protein VMV49_12300 [Candidatus Deferrimicrobium sp.]|nr:hypothetical protein [Candidatus Deferrimicrobium sp.]